MSGILRRAWSARARLHLALLARVGLLPRVNLVVRTEVGGRRFKVPVTQGIGLPSADSERWMDVVLARLLRRPGALLDVGANLGQTLLKVKALAPELEYVGFEPSLRCAWHLRQLIALNAFERCRLYPVALGCETAMIELLSGSETDPAATTVPGFRADETRLQRQYVSVFRGDDLVRDLAGEVAAVKIDVEGGELDVLVGLEQTIARHRPAIICEVLPVYDECTPMGRRRLQRQTELEAFLRARAYSLSRITPDGELVPIERIGVHGDLALSNYVFSPAR